MAILKNKTQGNYTVVSQNIINESACDIEFKYMYDKGIARVILSGSEDQVIDIMKKYYN